MSEGRVHGRAGKAQRGRRKRWGPTERLQQSRDVYAEARQAVLVRDAFQCVRCRGAAQVTHHRRPRGMGGGSRNPDAHAPSHLLGVCNLCHLWIESHREESEAAGWLVPMGLDPAGYPVLRFGQWWLIDDQGGTAFTSVRPADVCHTDGVS